MNETQTKELIPEEEISKEIPPFQVGDLVQMRAKALRLIRFFRYPEDDVGIVIEVKKAQHTDDWFVNIHWQKFIPKNGKSIIKHTRLKKVRNRRNV